MPGKPGYSRSGYYRTRVEWQHTTLMTQGRPSGSEQKNFDVFLPCSRGWPDANLPTIRNFEVRNVLDPDKGTFRRVLKHKSAFTFRDGRTPSCDANCDIDVAAAVHQRWHTSERDFG